MELKNGILIINKPKDFTSFDIVAIMRKLLNFKKIGHTGTLDPLATGVLVLLIGTATKTQIFIENHNKEYIAALKFGITTDTFDITGKILNKFEKIINFTELTSSIQKFIGEIEQIPPMYSAVKINGKKLYELARQGVEIKRSARKVFIEKIEILDFCEREQSAQLKIVCSKGTYIRTLCSDLGCELNCGAVMTSLCRTKCNGFSIDESISLDETKALAENNLLENKILPTEILFKNFNSININGFQYEKFKNGMSLKISNIFSFLNNIKNNEILKLYYSKKFVGLGKFDLTDNKIVFLKQFYI